MDYDLQNLELPGLAVDSADFGADLIARIEAFRRGELASYSLEEVREMMREYMASRNRPPS